jgi:hypothetical protein
MAMHSSSSIPPLKYSTNFGRLELADDAAGGPGAYAGGTKGPACAGIDECNAGGAMAGGRFDIEPKSYIGALGVIGVDDDSAALDGAEE